MKIITTSFGKKWIMFFAIWIVGIVIAIFIQLHYRNEISSILLMAITISGGLAIVLHGIDLAGSQEEIKEEIKKVKEAKGIK